MDVDKATQLKEEGNGYFKKGDYQTASTLYFEALKYNPDNVIVLGNIGQCFINLSKLKEAQDILEIALKYGPDNTKNNYRLGMVHFKLGNLTEASKCFKSVLRLEPNNKVARSQLNLITDQFQGSNKVEQMLNNKINELQTNLNKVSLQPSSNGKPVAAGTLKTKKVAANNEPLPKIKLDSFKLPDKLPQTQFQFTCVWNEVQDKVTRFDYLIKIGIDNFCKLFSKGLEPNLFSQVLDALTCCTNDFAINLLLVLNRLSRFDTLIMFMGPNDKQNIDKIVAQSQQNGHLDEHNLAKLKTLYHLSK